MVNSEDTVEQIRERADIVNIIGTYVELRKQGRDFIGVCPFHTEKTPSFSVSAVKKFYYCFGCHASGDVFSFVMRHEGLDFPGALRKLGPLVGVEVASESPRERERRARDNRLVKANLVAHDFFMAQLGAPEARGARKYLQERQIPARFARSSRLGFGGESVKFFGHLESKGVSKEVAVEAGLLTHSGERCLFDGKVIFPIFSDGQLVGFGGRRIGDGKGPKYVNSGESVIFQKSTLLYGWDEAQDGLRRSKRAVLVEGYTDVLACQRAGIQGAMAVLGTAFTPEHVKRISRLAKSVVLVLDGDAAGLRASREAAIKVLGGKLKASVVALPAGEDPDSVLRKEGGASLKERVEKGLCAVEYFMGEAFGGEPLSVEEKSTAAASLAPLLEVVASGLERDLYVAEVADKVGVSVEQMERHLRESLEKKKKKSARPRVATPPQREPKGGQPDGFSGPPAGEAPAWLQEEARQGEWGQRDAEAPQASGEGDVIAPPKPRPDRRELDVLREVLLYPELRPRLKELADNTLTAPMETVWEQLSEVDTELKEVLGDFFSPAQVASLLQVTPAVTLDESERAEAAQRTFDDVSRKLKVYHLRLQVEEIRTLLLETERAGEDATVLLNKKIRLSRKVRELEQRG